MAEIEKDAVSGQETTGHEWDGIKELNTPMPRWWLYTFYATIVWAIGYWVVYPAWPSLSGYTKGMAEFSSRADLRADLAAQEQERSGWTSKFAALSVNEIAADPKLAEYARAGGRTIFADNCAPCHGSAGSGAKGYPVLADDDWLWGGKLETIHTTIRYGVRSTHGDTRVSDMPKFGAEEILETAAINDVTEFVLSLSGSSKDTVAAKRGKEVFSENCSACHGEAGEGLQDMGAPRLSDGIWLYGGAKETVLSQVNAPKQGVMPHWEGRLDDTALKQVAIYVHSLGGGQ